MRWKVISESCNFRYENGLGVSLSNVTIVTFTHF